MKTLDPVSTNRLEINGAELDRTDFADLWAAVEGSSRLDLDALDTASFWAGNGVDTFTLLDFRALFMRGWDNGRGLDAARGLGALQLDAFQAHEHRYDRAYSRDGDSSGGYNQASEQNNQSTEAILQRSGFSPPRVADETRPVNAAAVFCMVY